MEGHCGHLKKQRERERDVNSSKLKGRLAVAKRISSHLFLHSLKFHGR